MTECLRECLYSRRHVISRSIQATRQADDKSSQAVFLLSEPSDLRGGAIQRVLLEARCLHDAYRTGQRPSCIAHGDTDSTFPNIQSSYTTHSV